MRRSIVGKGLLLALSLVLLARAPEFALAHAGHPHSKAQFLSEHELAHTSKQSGTYEIGADDSINLFSRSELIQDGAIGPIIPLASIDQTLQNTSYVLKSLYAGIQVGKMCLGQPAYCVAAPLLVAPKPEQFANFFDWKAEQSCSLDEAEFVDVTHFVCPVAVRLPVDSSEETDALIIADQFDGYPRQSCGVADTEHMWTSLRRDWSLPSLETLASKCQMSSLPGRQCKERKLEVADANTDPTSADRGDLCNSVKNKTLSQVSFGRKQTCRTPVRALS